MENILTLCSENRWTAIVIFVGLEGRRLETMRQTVSNFNVRIVNIPTFVERPDLYYAIDQHWNPKGHAVVAQQVLDALPASGISQPLTSE